MQNWPKSRYTTSADTADWIPVELRDKWKPGVLLFKLENAKADIKSHKRFALLLGLKYHAMRSGLATWLGPEDSAESVIESLLNDYSALQTRDNWVKQRFGQNDSLKLRLKNANIAGETGSAAYLTFIKG